MGIESFVFNFFNKPELDIIGDIAFKGNLNNKPNWINQKSKSYQNSDIPK